MEEIKAYKTSSNKLFDNLSEAWFEESKYLLDEELRMDFLPGDCDGAKVEPQVLRDWLIDHKKAVLDFLNCYENVRKR